MPVLFYASRRLVEHDRNPPAYRSLTGFGLLSAEFKSGLLPRIVRKTNICSRDQFSVPGSQVVFIFVHLYIIFVTFINQSDFMWYIYFCILLLIPLVGKIRIVLLRTSDWVTIQTKPDPSKIGRLPRIWKSRVLQD